MVLLKSIRMSTFLSTLILDGNQLSGNGFQQMEELLTSSCPLTYLSCADCQINSAECFLVGLNRNHFLNTLILRNNVLGDTIG
jgi:hypothetical protein